MPDMLTVVLLDFLFLFYGGAMLLLYVVLQLKKMNVGGETGEAARVTLAFSLVTALVIPIGYYFNMWMFGYLSP